MGRFGVRQNVEEEPFRWILWQGINAAVFVEEGITARDAAMV